jgi:uncharacterized protein (TIGR03435 family)
MVSDNGPDFVRAYSRRMGPAAKASSSVFVRRASEDMEKPMNRVRRRAAATASIGMLTWLLPGAAGVAAQGANAHVQAFEVASVRPSSVDRITPSPIETRPGGSVVAINVSLRRLIRFAYGLDNYVASETVEGASTLSRTSGRLLDDRFDVIAKAAGDLPLARAGNVGPLNLMMQRLLADRFKLAVRWDERPQQGYALVRLREDGSLGPRARRSDLDCSDPAREKKRTGDPRSCTSSTRIGEMKTSGYRMADLARVLSISTLSPVIDRTGIAGAFDFEMTYDQSEFTLPGTRPATEPSGAPSLFKAIQDQLGLKLERQSIPVPMLVVEHVEPPSEN